MKTLVIGMARSGLACVRLLARRGDHVIANDSKDENAFGEKLDQIRLNGVELRLGEDPVPILEEGVDRLIISPGVPIDAPVVVKAREAGIEVLGELEYAYRESCGTLVAVTGTNGKTTTVTLLGEIFREAGKRTWVVGNIGEPYSGAVPEMKEDDVTVCEVSSFQMETADRFHPSVCAVLNITEDHLNRHKTMETYIAMKKRIFARCSGDDCVVLNYEDPFTREMAKDVKCNLVWFSTERPVPYGAFLAGGEIVFGSANSWRTICPADRLQIPGKHNVANALAATAAAMCAGVGPEVIRRTLERFTSVEHRIEFTREVSGVRFYNDSKGTNVDSTLQAIRAMDRSTVMILGGSDKHADFIPLMREVRDSKVEHIILIGDTAQQLRQAADQIGGISYEMAGYDFLAAVERAYAFAKEGWNVLLSPACASFDMFSDYEARGRIFKEMVRALKEK